MGMADPHFAPKNTLHISLYISCLLCMSLHFPMFHIFIQVEFDGWLLIWFPAKVTDALFLGPNPKTSFGLRVKVKTLVT